MNFVDLQTKTWGAVSYTHLDVYKRQASFVAMAQLFLAVMTRLVLQPFWKVCAAFRSGVYLMVCCSWCSRFARKLACMAQKVLITARYGPNLSLFWMQRDLWVK